MYCEYSIFKILSIPFIIMGALLNISLIHGQEKLNTITFDNQSGELALVKLVGPTYKAVEVPDKSRITVIVSAGEYYILTRYGSNFKEYRYAKGDNFNVTTTATEYSAISITLHRVLDGNYSTLPVSAEEFYKEFNPDVSDVASLGHLDIPIGHYQDYQWQQSINGSIFTSEDKIHILSGTITDYLAHTIVGDYSFSPRGDITKYGQEGTHYLILIFKTDGPRIGDFVRDDYVIQDTQKNKYYPIGLSLNEGYSFFIVGDFSFGDYLAEYDFKPNYVIKSAICFELPTSNEVLCFNYKDRPYVLPPSRKSKTAEIKSNKSVIDNRILTSKIRELKDAERNIRSNSSEMVIKLEELADLYESQGQHAEAAQLYERLLSIKEKAMGPDHSDLVKSLNNLAGLYKTQGQYALAEPLYKRLLAIREQTLGPDHSDLVTSLNDLADLYVAQGQYIQAEPLYKRSLVIREKKNLISDLVASINSLAALYKAQGQYAQAEPLFKRALAIVEKALGPDHPLIATSLNNLAELYKDQGQYALAELLYKRSLAIIEKSLGPDSPNIAASLNKLAELCKDQGQYTQAEPLFMWAQAIWEKALGPDHPKVALSIENLAGLYRKTGRETEAAELEKRAEVIRTVKR